MLRKLHPGETPNTLVWNALIEQLQSTSGPFIAATAPTVFASSPSAPDLRPRGLEFRNDSGIVAPAHAVLRITGFSTTDGHRALLAEQPNATLARLYAVNGPSSVPAGQYGLCYMAGIVEVLYATGTPVIGESFGPQSGSWAVSKDLPGGFHVIGIVDAAQQIVACQIEPPTTLLGKLAGPLADGLPATVEVWGGAAGAESAIPGLSITAFNWLLPPGAFPIAAGAKVICQRINSAWYVTAIV